MYLTKKASFKDTLVEALGLCYRIVFQPVLSLDVSTQTVFFYITCPKSILWGIISAVFRVHVTPRLLCQTDEINTIFNPSVVIHMGAQVNSSAIANLI